MKISAETKSSFSDNEKIVVIFKKFFDRKWHCKYRYTSSKNGLKLSISSSFICFNCMDECSSFFYAVNRAEFDIKRLFQADEPKNKGKLFENILKKYSELLL